MKSNLRVRSNSFVWFVRCLSDKVRVRQWVLNTLIKLMRHWRGHGCQSRSRKDISSPVSSNGSSPGKWVSSLFLSCVSEAKGLVLEISHLHAIFEAGVQVILTIAHPLLLCCSMQIARDSFLSFQVFNPLTTRSGFRKPELRLWTEGVAEDQCSFLQHCAAHKHSAPFRELGLLITAQRSRQAALNKL